ncbi:cadherin repeat domain-containing protein, partial [Microvirga terrestris]
MPALNIVVASGGVKLSDTNVGFNENIASDGQLFLIGTVQNVNTNLTYDWADQGGVAQNAGGRYTFVPRTVGGQTHIEIYVAAGMGGATNFNFEAGSFHEVVLQGKNSLGNVIDQGNFRVTLTNVNEAPLTLTLTNTANPSFTWMENRPAGTLIGELGSTDPDTTAAFGRTSHRYSIADTNPENIRNAYEIIQNPTTRRYELVVKQNAVIDWDSLPAGAKYHDVAIIVTDMNGSGLSRTETFRINLTNDPSDDPQTTNDPPTTPTIVNGTVLSLTENAAGT